MQTNAAALQTRRGIAEWLVAGVGTAVLGALFRHLRLSGVTTAQLMLLRYCGQVVVGVAAGYMFERSFGFLRMRLPMYVIGRGIAVFAAAGCVVTAQGLLPVSEVIAIGFVWPALVVAWIAIRGESVTRREWFAVLLCMIGVFVESGMSTASLSSPGVLWVLGAAVANAVNVRLGQLALNAGESPLTSVAWTGFTGLAMVGAWWLAQPSVFAAMPPSAGTFLPVVVVVVAGLVQLFMTTAPRHEPMTKLMPLTYVQVVWAILLDLMVFDHAPSTLAYVGIGLILVGAALATASQAKPKPAR